MIQWDTLIDISIFNLLAIFFFQKAGLFHPARAQCSSTKKIDTMSPPQHWSLTLTLAVFVAICHPVTTLPLEYCSDINTSSNNKNASIYQSNGLCYTFCANTYAFAILQDDGCWCSNYIPASTSDTTSCDTACPGYPPDTCGGPNLYAYIALPNTPSGTEGGSSEAPSTTAAPTQVNTTPSPSPVTVYETITSTPDFSPSSILDSISPFTASTSDTVAKVTTTKPTTSSTWTPTPVVSLETVTGEVRTVTVTPTTPPSGQSTSLVTKTKNSGSFGTGAAVGLTIGLVALIGIICAIIYFCFRKRREDQAEDGLNSRRGSSAGLGGPPVRTMSQNSRFVLNTDGHRVVENWENGDAPGSRRSKLIPVDPRLDPFSPVYKRGLADNKSRESINTIRDDHDYSRRVHQQAPILRATNPDELDD